MIFEGQKVLEQVLQETNCPKSIHEIYFFIRGLISGTNMAPPSAWFGWLFDGKEPVYDSQEQAQKLMGNIMGLWNFIADAQHKGSSLPDIKVEILDTVDGLKQRINLINKKTIAYIKGLDHADTDPMEMTPDGRDAMKSLTEGDVYCTKYLVLDREDFTSEKLKDVNKQLDDLEDVFEDCIYRINISLDEARKTAIPRPKTPQKSEKIPRNEPCPCGSGKKYKKCCWLKLH